MKIPQLIENVVGTFRAVYVIFAFILTLTAAGFIWNGSYILGVAMLMAAVILYVPLLNICMIIAGMVIPKLYPEESEKLLEMMNQDALEINDEDIEFGPVIGVHGDKKLYDWLAVFDDDCEMDTRKYFYFVGPVYTNSGGEQVPPDGADPENVIICDEYAYVLADKKPQPIKVDVLAI